MTSKANSNKDEEIHSEKQGDRQEEKAPRTESEQEAEVRKQMDLQPEPPADDNETVDQVPVEKSFDFGMMPAVTVPPPLVEAIGGEIDVLEDLEKLVDFSLELTLEELWWY